MTARYVELHAASAFSFLEGASQPETLIERAVALQMPAIALLDRNGIYGSARCHTSAKRNMVRAHVGAEISVRGLGSRLAPPAWLPHQHVAEPARVSLLCESREGYRNLCRLITRFKMREKPQSRKALQISIDLQRVCQGTRLPDRGRRRVLWRRRSCVAARKLVARWSRNLIRIYGPQAMSMYRTATASVSESKSGGIRQPVRIAAYTSPPVARDERGSIRHSV